MDEELSLALRLPTRPVSVAIARGALRLLHRVVASQLEGAELVLSELVTNAVRHGSPHKDDVVDVEITVGADWLRAVVRDNGPPFDPLAAHRAADGTGGFGLHIARNLAKLSVERSDNGNIVSFTVPLGNPVATEPAC